MINRVEASCTADGKVEYTCACGHSYTETLKKLSHNYETKTIKKATWTNNGKRRSTCTICGKATTKTIRKVSSAKLSTTSYTYDGKTKTPTVTIKDSNGTKLKEGTDYTVTYAKGRKNVGTYKVTIKLKGKYSGTKTLTFKIKPINVSKCKITLSTTSYTYNGKTKTPSVTVKNASGKKLKKGTDYTVTYAKGRKNVGTYKVTVKMKGKYSGTKTLTFKIKPAETKISKAIASQKKISVTIAKKTNQVSGYEIQYATSKKFTNAKTQTINSYKTTKITLKNLKANQNYYVRVRTYKTVNRNKVYSGWSTYKCVKTLK